MASRSRGRQSACSSRSASPTTPPAPYDPFTSPDDPIELRHVHRPFSHTRDSFGARGPSPLGSPDLNEEFRGRGSLRPDSYFGLSTHTGGSYAQLSGRNESPRPSMRSNRDSTYTLNSLYHTKTVDADTQALVDRRAGEIAKWHVHWTTPAIIGSLFTLGVIAAVGHHFFYTSLNGKPASGQLQMIRYGTAFAFFVKSTLTGCAIMCNRQRIWRTFRRKAMTIDGIDGLFSAPEDPTQFFINGEMWRNGKLATVMALTCWLIPIASVMSPASLTSELTNSRTQAICENVASIDFSRESTFDFREMDDAEIRRASMSYYNTTDLDGKLPGFFDYYDQPSKNVRRLAISAAYLRRPQPRDRAGLTFCGDGWNCTYTLNFEGPGYKCDNMTNAGHMKSPIDLDTLAPKGNFTYVADVDRNDYKNPQIETVRGVPKQGPPYPASLGVFDSEPVLWIGFADKLNTTYPEDSPYAAKWKVVHVPKMFRCVMHHTNYTFEMSYQPSQTATLKKRDFLHPVVDTTVQRGATNGTEWIASPEANFIRPQNPTLYKHVAAYHSMGSLLRNFLRGYVEKTTDTFTVTSSDISETRLMDARTSHPIPTLMDDVQDLFEDMIISLLSEPTLVVSNNITVPCEKTRQMNTYRYYKRGLWIGYAVVIGVTFCFILIGAWSIFQNGVASDVLFSRIMTTTRNPTLDHLSVGACLGGDPFPKELLRTKLRFGVLLEENPREGPLGVVEHCCFGTVGETKEVVKGGTYAGLAKYRTGYRQEEATVDEKAGLLGKDS